MATANKDVQFIGISADEFIAHTEAEIKAGAWADGTKLKPHVREALGQFTKAARAQRARATNYVFVWSRFIFIKIEF